MKTAPLRQLLLGIGVRLLMVGLIWLSSESLAQPIWFGAGLGVGWLILELDARLAFNWYNQPGETWKVTRSPVFLLAFGPLWIFVITSSGSLIGAGIVQSMLWGYLPEIWTRLSSPTKLVKHFQLDPTFSLDPSQTWKIRFALVVVATLSLAVLVL